MIVQDCKGHWLQHFCPYVQPWCCRINRAALLCLCRYQQHVNGTGPPRWLLCQASTVQQPATGAQVIMLLQLDITESQQVGWTTAVCGSLSVEDSSRR